MKNERRWQDRTGAARDNLRCRVYDSGKALRLAASHGVPYGVYLEHGHQGRYAILQPTVSSQWPGPNTKPGSLPAAYERRSRRSASSPG